MSDFDEQDRRVSVRTLLVAALIIVALGALMLLGPWKELQNSTGYAASLQSGTR